MRAPALAEIGSMVSKANHRAREIARGLVAVIVDTDGLLEALNKLSGYSGFGKRSVFTLLSSMRKPRGISIVDISHSASGALKSGSPTI